MGIDEDEKRARSSRRSFLKVGAGVLASAALASVTVSQIPLVSANGSPAQISALQTQLSTSQSQLSSTQSQLTTATSQVTTLSTIANAFRTLSANEVAVIEAAIETLIPTDSNGPGGKEAGVIFFIDGQLAEDYGKLGNMFMQGPFISPGISKPVIVNGITYSGGTPAGTMNVGYGYQYSLNLREFWRTGVAALESYSNTAYGANFEDLSAANKAAALADIANGKPTSFNNIKPADFFYELFFMTWAGFLMDPMYGGNREMIGWNLTGFNGLNQGDFYGEGLTTQQLMVASTPTKLKPASLAQFQAAAGYTPNLGGD